MSATAIEGISAATSRSLVLSDLRGGDAESVLAELSSGLASELDGIPAATVLSGFLQRERLGTTAIADGLAIPHCRLEQLGRIRLAVGLHRRGVAFGAPDGRLTRLFFAVVSPAAAPGSHLALLASIARWARRPGRIDALISAGDAGAMLEILVGADATDAAP